MPIRGRIRNLCLIVYHFFPTPFERRLFPIEKSPFLCLVLSVEEERELERFNESDACRGRGGEMEVEEGQGMEKRGGKRDENGENEKGNDRMGNQQSRSMEVGAGGG